MTKFTQHPSYWTGQQRPCCGWKSWQPRLDCDALRELIGKPDPLILEIGASDCEDTQLFLDAFPDCRVICFEPDERPLQRYRRNIPITERRVTVEPLVVTDIDGLVTWYASHGVIPECSQNDYPWQSEVKNDWDLSGSTCRPTGHLEQSDWCTFSSPVHKPGICLDTYTSQHGIGVIDFIWADIQGAEAKFIAGARESLVRTRYLLTEFYDIQLSHNPYNLPEMYEGQPNLGMIMALLPGWTIRSFHAGDNVLLENRDFT